MNPTKGWWVGDPDAGGLLVVAPNYRVARRMGADALGWHYSELRALRVPALDGRVAGIVAWDEAVRLGAAIRCGRCCWEMAATRKARQQTQCPECGAWLETAQGVAR